MKLWVYSEMLIRSVEPHDEPHIIISIYTPGGPRARFKTHKTATHAVLFVEFPDRSSTRRTRMRSSTSWTITGTSSRFSASARAACHAP